MDLLEYLVLSLMVVLLGFWNGLVIKWYLTRDNKWSKYWHILGYIIRALPVIILYPNIVTMLIYTSISWVLYDILINIINGWGIFYVGNTSWLDKTFGKYLFIPKVLLLISTIIYILL